MFYSRYNIENMYRKYAYLCMIGVTRVSHVDFSGLQRPQEMSMCISLTEQTAIGYKTSSHYLYALDI